MPASQLKRLKAAAHEQRVAKLKGHTKPSASSTNGTSRPPAKKYSKASAQERSHALRAQQLLPEIHARKKVGGILDRRIGEDDPSLAPEEKAARRMAAERQRASKKRDAFNLEDADDDEEVSEMLLTHGGKPLGPAPGRSMQEMVDDFEASDIGSDEEDTGATREKKRKRLEEQVEEMMTLREAEPAKKRSKKEIMEEVIAKSKLHKYERQRQKEEDEDERDELAKSLPGVLAMLRGKGAPPRKVQEKTESPQANGVHPDRLQIMDKKTKEQVEKEYDQNFRQMIQDKRAQPTERTRTAEEKAKDEAERLRELEDKRQRRMRGEPTSSDEEDDDDDDEHETAEPGVDVEEDPDDYNEAVDFGFTNAVPDQKAPAVDVEEEDDFIIDDDLVASGSDLEADLSSFEDSDEGEDQGDDDEEFLRDVMADEEKASTAEPGSKPLAYTYACPQTAEELETLLKGVGQDDIPTVVQRIRALYHPQLAAENKGKMANFAASLVACLSTLARPGASLSVINALIRHVHSLAKTHGDAVGKAFRAQLSEIHARARVTNTDLVTFTAIGSIYPTSDHFHQVVTPAITLIARWLGTTTPISASDSLIGSYLVALAIKYQRLSKRYIPEILRFTAAALQHPATLGDASLVTQHLRNLSQTMDLWVEQKACPEMFHPRVTALLAPGSALDAAHPKPARALHQKLRILLSQAQLRRRPLELHHHRPLPIKSVVPKFEENFDPAGHYDADRERADAARLQKEYRREKKGALRELRRDAEFMAREQLREKKEKDRRYEEKQRRIIGEIQREEGREKNEYERERAKRKGRF